MRHAPPFTSPHPVCCPGKLFVESYITAGCLALLVIPVTLLGAQRPVESAVAPDKVLRAGAATSNITPPLGVSVSGGFQDRTARHIHDELHVRCLALDNGTTKLVLATIDTALVDRRLCDAAKRQVHEATGLPMQNMLMSATHAHSGGTLMPVGQSEPDPAYQAFVTQRIADGIRRALNNLEPARIGWGFGEVPQHVFNRRWHLKPGTVAPNPFGQTGDRVSMNPGAGNPNLVRPAGPTDPQVWFISVQSLGRRPIAVYANYSLHYVGGVGPDHISADYFGAFADRIQELLGADRQDPPFVGIMSNGASGDINNIDVRSRRPKPPPYGQIRLVANDVAQEVARVCQTLQYHTWVPLGIAPQELILGLRRPDPSEIVRARDVMKSSKTFPRMITREEVYARETVLLQDFPPQVSAPIQVMMIGGLRVAALPAEPFVEIGLELRRKHPNSFIVSLANAYHGYLPTRAQHELGGYETWRSRWACLEIDASEKIVDALNGLFERLR